MADQLLTLSLFLVGPVSLHTHPATHVSASMATDPTGSVSSSVTAAFHAVLAALHAVLAPVVILAAHCQAGNGKNH